MATDNRLGQGWGMLFEAKDPLGRRIILSEDWFQTHILLRHPELAKRKKEMQHALEDPEFITKAGHGRTLYYRKWDAGPNFLRVVVQLEQGGRHGFVVTAYWCAGRTGGEIEWPRI